MTGVYFNNVDATVNYKDVHRNVSESDGSVEHVLVLSKPLPTDASITINITHGNTAGKLCTVAINCQVYNMGMKEWLIK